MACCGQKRQSMSASAGAATRASTASPSAGVVSTAQQGDVRLVYRGRGGFAMRSVRTGRAYACGSTGAVLSVDPRDAEPLIRTRLFNHV